MLVNVFFLIQEQSEVDPLYKKQFRIRRGPEWCIYMNPHFLFVLFFFARFVVLYYKCRFQVLVSSVGFKCWFQVLVSSVGFNFQVLVSSVGFKCWFQVLVSSVVFKCWFQVLVSSVGFKCCENVKFLLAILNSKTENC